MRRIEAVSGRILPYPDVAHDELARRAIARRKPFADSGKGYRDALIWESILAAARQDTEPIAFITSNTADFAAPDGRLHEDLVEDLVDSGLSQDAVVLFRDLKEFMHQNVTPHLEELESVKAKLQTGESPGQDLREVLMERLGEALGVMDLDEPFDIGMPEGLFNLKITSVRDVRDIAVTEVWRLPSGELLAEIQVVAECSLSFLIGIGTFLTLSKQRAMAIDYHGTGGDDWSDATAVAAIGILLLLTLDPVSTQVTSIETVEVYKAQGAPSLGGTSE